MSGAGQGELSGLKWSDADWENNQIHIRRTFNNQKWYDTKSKTSNRKIDLGPAVMKELKEWKLASLPNESSLVFPNNAGNPVSHNNMVKPHFKPALKKAGLPQIRFHDLRHTYYSRSEVRTHFSGPTDIFISGHPVVIICVRTYAVVYYAGLLIEQGENVKYIQTQLGHFTPTVTLNAYAHLMKPANQEPARRLENTVFEESGSKMLAENKKGLRQKP